MLARLLKRVGVACIVGMVVGLAMLLPLFFGIELTKWKTLYDAINAPALWFAERWIFYYRLPPQTESAWGLIPMIMIFVQWTAIGFFAGLWWAFKLSRKNGHTIKPDER